MKKNDIKAGIIYGYAAGTSEYRHAHPVVVLDTATLWTWYRPRRGDLVYRVSTDNRYAAARNSWDSFYGPHGYLVLTGTSWASGEETEAHHAEMLELYKEFAATAKNPDAVNDFAAKVGELEGFHIDIVNNRWIEGGYVESKTAEAERRQAREDQARAERDRAAAEQSFRDEAAAVMGAKLEREVFVGKDYGWNGNDRVSISFADLAAFLGIKSPKERL